MDPNTKRFMLRVLEMLSEQQQTIVSLSQSVTALRHVFCSDAKRYAAYEAAHRTIRSEHIVYTDEMRQRIDALVDQVKLYR